MSGIRQGRWAYKARLKLIEQLGGRCALCGRIDDLEIDHINGRTYELRRLSRWQRVANYKREAALGLIRVLCATCNGQDGGTTMQARRPDRARARGVAQEEMMGKAAVSKREREEFVRVAQLLHGEVAEFFKPKENQTIRDFIVTAGKEP